MSKKISLVAAIMVSALLSLPLALPTAAQDRDQDAEEEEEEEEEDGPPELNSGLLSGLQWRNIGPALTSGRVADIAVDPVDRSTWYVAAASGGVWKTTNAGTSWRPIFDRYGSYSIGALAIDPSNHLVVWVGTGENNGQRSVGYGDGIYKSLDGGGSFEKMGLENSEHIGMIRIHPENPDIVYVAAQGPIWASGGDRGLYRTTDSGGTWEPILEIDEHTGVSEVYFDPRDPDVMYAVSWQRRRHQWTMIDGGPGSGIHKSTDGGDTWRRINRGLPSGDKGRIGFAISPIDPEVLYAIVEASGDDGGTFRSDNMGERWTRASRRSAGAAMYYHEIFADPHRFDRIYSMETRFMVSDDGGRNWDRMPTDNVHVDYHALAFDPADPEHLIVGNDGGLYETLDGGQNWRYFSNLPITQFYKVAVSNDEPFYYVYGGTQDNNTLGGPSRTNTSHGIRNSDWYVTLGGDGFDPVVDPENPDIIYSQLQHGTLSRFDRKTSERLDIKPREDAEGPALRWYWDAGLAMSPHSNTRLYFGAQILFRSDDRGSSWRAVSGDLSRNIDRNQLPVMGRVWSVDAVAKNRSTSSFGTIVSISESPIVEDLLYVGTDDGLLQVSEDGGQNWRAVESFPGVPDTSFVHDVEASLHDANTVFAVLNNFKRGDFRPHVVKSTDRGLTWTSIGGDLPENGPTFTIAQDHVEPNLLFVGTEFGAYATVDGGTEWMKLGNGMPTIPVRDIEIQRRESDLAVASFGRGFFILDDYTPLRELAAGTDEILARNGHIFSIKPAEMFVTWGPMGGGDRASQGAGFYVAPNPDFGATFTYYLRETLRTREAQRQRREGRAARDGNDTPYPSWEELKTEDREEDPEVFLTVRDQDGHVVRHIDGSTSRGVRRATWNFRYPGYTPLGGGGGGGFGGFGGGGGSGPLAMPGSYTVSLSQRVDGVVAELVAPTRFEVEVLGQPSLPAQDRAAVLAFQRQTGELQRAVMGTSRAAADAAQRLGLIKEAVEATPSATEQLRVDARALELRLMDLQEALNGDRTRPSRAEPGMPGIISRVNSIVSGHWRAVHGPTQTHRQQYEIAAAAFSDVYDDLRQLLETDLPALERQLEAVGAPWTPGRALPGWTRPNP